MKKSILSLLIIIIIIATIIVGYFVYQQNFAKKQIACPMFAKLCPDGSSVSPQGPKCQVPACPGAMVYKNEEYEFEITLPNSWSGYSVAKQQWQGWAIDDSGKTYSGPEILIKNPQTNATQQYQDIPIMIFTHEQWGPDSNITGVYNPAGFAVSAAPIGPAKIGENSKYVFATPPRWYGFTDAIGWQEAVDIVKTFKAF